MLRDICTIHYMINHVICCDMCHIMHYIMHVHVWIYIYIYVYIYIYHINQMRCAQILHLCLRRVGYVRSQRSWGVLGAWLFQAFAPRGVLGRSWGLLGRVMGGALEPCGIPGVSIEGPRTLRST